VVGISTEKGRGGQLDKLLARCCRFGVASPGFGKKGEGGAVTEKKFGWVVLRSGFTEKGKKGQG